MLLQMLKGSPSRDDSDMKLLSKICHSEKKAVEPDEFSKIYSLALAFTSFVQLLRQYVRKKTL